jgi:hypothetical protein
MMLVQVHAHVRAILHVKPVTMEILEAVVIIALSSALVLHSINVPNHNMIQQYSGLVVFLMEFVLAKMG